MCAASTQRLIDLYGAMWGRYLRLRQATDEVFRAEAAYRYTKRFCFDAKKYLRLQLMYDRSKLEAAEKRLFSAGCSLVERKEAANDYAKYRESVKQAEADIMTLETTVDESRSHRDDLEKRCSELRKDHGRAVRWFAQAAINHSTMKEVWIFGEFLKAGVAGFEMKKDGSVHVYCRYKGDIHYQQGHLKIMPDGGIDFCRTPREERPEIRRQLRRLRVEGFLVYDGVRIKLFDSHPFHMQSLFFDKSTALVLPKIGIDTVFA